LPPYSTIIILQYNQHDNLTYPFNCIINLVPGIFSAESPTEPRYLQTCWKYSNLILEYMLLK